MNRTLLISALSVLGLAAVGRMATAAPSSPILPGYWESTNKVLFPVRKVTVERRCITPAQVAKFMEGPHNHIYACEYPTRVIENGKILLKGQCRDKKGLTLAVTGHGDYTPTSFALKAAVKLAGLPITFDASTEARRLGDICPPDAKGASDTH